MRPPDAKRPGVASPVAASDGPEQVSSTGHGTTVVADATRAPARRVWGARRKPRRPILLHYGPFDNVEIATAWREGRALVTFCGVERVPLRRPFPPRAVLCRTCLAEHERERGGS